MKRILNVGLPFAGRRSGDASRAAMEDRVLRTRFSVDHLLLIREEDMPIEAALDGGGETFTLVFRPGSGLSSVSVCQFQARELGRLAALVSAKQYDAVFFRYICGTTLAEKVKEVLPKTQVIVDADMLSSRIATQAWRQNRSIHNRFFLGESWKLRRYERRLFEKPYLFLLSNSSELAWVRKHYLRHGAPSRFALVLNAMPEVPADIIEAGTQKDSRYILFHGVLTSVVNMDAFRFLVEDIYPRVRDVLERHGVYIHVVGKGLSATHHEWVRRHGCKRIALIGEVEDIGRAVMESLFCLIPLRIGSGTKTRVLEAAAYGKAVVTTPIGAEGLNFSERDLVVRESAMDLSNAIAELLDNPTTLHDLGTNIKERCHGLYSEEAICRQLIAATESCFREEKADDERI